MGHYKKSRDALHYIDHRKIHHSLCEFGVNGDEAAVALFLYRIVEEVGYWRKANQIHNWFVDKVQDGEDDCEYHHEVTKEILEELLDTCETVLASCELVDGKIKNGEHMEDGNWIPIMEDGKYIKNPSVAMELLPTTSGFFFGSTDYDEYYVNDIKETIDIVTKVLETTDFEKEMVYYVSSW